MFHFPFINDYHHLEKVNIEMKTHFQTNNKNKPKYINNNEVKQSFVPTLLQLLQNNSSEIYKRTGGRSGCFALVKYHVFVLQHGTTS